MHLCATAHRQLSPSMGSLREEDSAHQPRRWRGREQQLLLSPRRWPHRESKVPSPLSCPPRRRSTTRTPAITSSAKPPTSAHWWRRSGEWWDSGARLSESSRLCRRALLPLLASLPLKQAERMQLMRTTPLPPRRRRRRMQKRRKKRWLRQGVLLLSINVAGGGCSATSPPRPRSRRALPARWPIGTQRSANSALVSRR